MAQVVVCGAGIVGLGAAMLLAKDGHQVTVLERDGAPVPEPSQAWAHWERRGITQFRLPHFLTGRFRSVVDTELPEVATALEAAGALRFDIIGAIPDATTGGRRPGDELLGAITARRPVVESVVARSAESTPGVEVRRGAAVEGLRCGPTSGGVVHATGVRLGGGEAVPADLVVDAMGRRSPLPAWLVAAGGRPPPEERADSGFVYYGRHLRSPSGDLPVLLGPLVQDCGSVSVITLPADNGTWSVVVVTSAADAALRPLRRPDRFAAAVSAMPLAAHWLDGEPIDDGVAVMAKIEDRRRLSPADGRPVVTGLLSVGDAWACTNPSLGRGASMGILHALALRQLLRTTPLDDPVALADQWSATTDAVVGPWYESTSRYDRHRLAEAEAGIAGTPYETDDPEWDFVRSLGAAASRDPDLLRSFLSMMSVFTTPGELAADPVLRERVRSLGDGWRQAAPLGPSREQLLATVAG